jgi:hypothetical protein
MPQLASHHEDAIRAVGTGQSDTDAERALSTIAKMPGHALRQALQAMDASQLTGFVQNIHVVNDELAVRELSDAVAGLRSSTSPSVARAVQATENVWRGIDEEFGLLKSGQVSELMGASRNNREFVSTRRRNGELLGAWRNSSYLYPGFQFDGQSGKVHPWVKPLLQLADELGQSAANVVFWMVTPSTLFDGARPVDRTSDGDKLVELARRSWSVQW